MLPITLGETSNGYPTIDVAEPYKLFGEFLRSEHSVKRAKRLFEGVESVLSGKDEEIEILQDYGKLTLNHPARTAHVWIDFLSKGTEEECAMPLELFHQIADAWLAHVLKRSA